MPKLLLLLPYTTLLEQLRGKQAKQLLTTNGSIISRATDIGLMSDNLDTW